MRGDWAISHYFLGKIYLQENMQTNFELFLAVLKNIGDVFQDRPSKGDYFNQMFGADSIFNKICVSNIVRKVSICRSFFKSITNIH
jgi:hypothetical protein